MRTARSISIDTSVDIDPEDVLPEIDTDVLCDELHERLTTHIARKKITEDQKKQLKEDLGLLIEEFAADAKVKSRVVELKPESLDEANRAEHLAKVWRNYSFDQIVNALP